MFDFSRSNNVKIKTNFVHTFFLYHTKIFSWFSHWKTPLILMFCQKMLPLGPFITSCFWGPAHHLYCNHYKTAWDSLSKWVGNIFWDGPYYGIYCTNLYSFFSFLFDNTKEHLSRQYDVTFKYTLYEISEFFYLLWLFWVFSSCWKFSLYQIHHSALAGYL